MAERADDGAGAASGRRREEDQRAGRGQGAGRAGGGPGGGWRPGVGGRAGGPVTVVPIRGGPQGYHKVLSASSNEARLSRIIKKMQEPII